MVPLKKSKSIQPNLGGMKKEGSVNLGVPSKKLDIVAEEIEEEEKLSPEELTKIKQSLSLMNQKRLTEKEDRIAKSSWWEWLNYTWAHDLLYRAQEGKSIKLEHLGGIKEEQSLKHRTKLLEDIYHAQPNDNKNIFMACLQAFWPMFVKGQLIMWTSWLCWFVQPKMMNAITAYIEDRQNTDLSYGFILLSGLLVNMMIEHYLDEHTFENNF